MRRMSEAPLVLQDDFNPKIRTEPLPSFRFKAIRNDSDIRDEYDKQAKYLDLTPIISSQKSIQSRNALNKSCNTTKNKFDEITETI